MASRIFWNEKFRRFFNRIGYGQGHRNGDIELLVLPSQNNRDKPSVSKMASSGSFLFIENVHSFFESAEVSSLLKDSSKVLLLKLEIDDVSNKFSTAELDKLAKKCVKNSIVILLATKDQKRFFVYWKSKRIQQFLMLKINDECDYMYDLRLFEFIAKFLTDSLRRGHLGLHSELKIDKTTTTFPLHLLADHRNYNLLLIAAELGSHDTNAQNLAFNGRHFDIVSSLLKSNLIYPLFISFDECPDDIKEFYEVSRSLNEAILSRNSEKVLEILSQNQEMKYFYNMDNESALAFALKHKLLDMYSLLLSKDVNFGPHEKSSEIKEKMNEGEREELRKIHNKEGPEEKIAANMEEALPIIEANAEVESQNNKKKISNLILILFVVGFLAIIGITFGIFVTRSIFYNPTYKFNELSVDKQKLVVQAPVIYKKKKIKFCDLFPENSTVYQNLTSDHISQMLNEFPLDFSDPHLLYLDELVTHSWQNLTGRLREKFFTSNFTFQNEKLMFKKLYEINSEVFNSLTSDQILEVLSDKKIVVHKMIKNETKFYVERKFWDENIKGIYCLFKEDFESSFGGFPVSTKNFEQYYRKFVEKDISSQIDEINQSENIKISEVTGGYFSEQTYNVWTNGKLTKYHIDSLSSHKSLQFNLDNVLKIANESKLFILSAEAGTGKVATFEHFTMRIKKKFPTQWVSYVDLKDHKALYKEVRTLQDVMKMLEKIFELNSENEFEKKIFDEFFEAGNLVLLWNGFDEISPDNSEDVMRILGLIRDNTKNIQFLCTRPLYSDQLRLKFSVQTYTLIPFDDEEQKHFLRMFLISQNIEETKIPNYIEKVLKIVDSTGSKEGFDTPLMLLMIAKQITNDVENYETENLYEIYRKFVEKKIDIWEKRELAWNFSNDTFTSNRQFDILKFYQSHAMKYNFQPGPYLVLQVPFFHYLKLKVMRQKMPKELTSDEISRMGILYINGPKNVKFAHRSFAEFFIAQYLIENIYNANDEPSDEEAELRILLFYKSFEYGGIRKFVDFYLQTTNKNESKPFDRQISRQLETKSQKLFLISLEEYGSSTLLFMLNFFKKDLEVLKKLLQIDENETVYTALFSYAFLNDRTQYDPLEIKNFVRPYLTDDEYDRLIYGKYQKGVILFSLYGLNCIAYRKLSIVHEKYTLDEKVLQTKDPFDAFEQIAKNLTKDEIKEFLKSKISFQIIHESEKMWNLIEKEFTELEQKKILSDIFGIFSFDKNQEFAEFYLKKLEKLFSGDEIFEILTNANVLYNNIDSKGFNILWDFFVNRTTREQQKSFLRHEMSVSLKIDLPFNLLLQSVFIGAKFDHILSMYESYFNTTEMQEIIFSSSTDFLPYFILHKLSNKNFLEYLPKVFTGNEKYLRKYLLRDIRPTNLNLFDFLIDYEDPLDILGILSNLLNSSLTA